MAQLQNTFENTKLVKTLAKQLGFDYCGIAYADFLADEAPRLENWLKNGKHGNMKYMENYFDKRLDPRLLVPNAKVVISLLYNYFPNKTMPKNSPQISKYAYGKDYHLVIKDKLKQFMQNLEEKIGAIEGRIFVDSAPVLEKAWAEKSGLGWRGKNSNLINKQSGSFFFLAEIICDLSLIADGPQKDYCGTCTRCIDACPTQAITPYVVDGSKCISYFTIELKDSIPSGMESAFGNWAFGCDVCMDVCPWNRFSKPHQEHAFEPNELLFEMTRADWENLTSEIFNKVFKQSAVKRAGFKGLMRNLKYISVQKSSNQL